MTWNRLSILKVISVLKWQSKSIKYPFSYISSFHFTLTSTTVYVSQLTYVEYKHMLEIVYFDRIVVWHFIQIRGWMCSRRYVSVLWSTKFVFTVTIKPWRLTYTKVIFRLSGYKNRSFANIENSQTLIIANSHWFCMTITIFSVPHHEPHSFKGTENIVIRMYGETFYYRYISTMTMIRFFLLITRLL